MRILIFGGTGEARELARALMADGHEVTSSLAGRTQDPLLPDGAVRIGGYGDQHRMQGFIREGAFTLIVDATHPFAEKISRAVLEASGALGLPLIRLIRPAWQQPAGAEWIVVKSIDAVKALIPPDAVLFVTTGQGAVSAVDWPQDCTRIVRVIAEPRTPPPPNVRLLLDRPPYSVAGEIALMREYGVTHVVTKNAGGGQTRAKIDAAAHIGIPVYMVERPVLPQVTDAVATVGEALEIIRSLPIHSAS